MVASLGFDMQTDSEFWIPDWGCEIELDLDVCQELGIVWLPNLNAVGGGLLFDQKVANHGTLTNSPTWTKGKFGEPALTFNGSNTRVELPVRVWPQTAFSFGCWATLASTSANYGLMIAYETTTLNYTQFFTFGSNLYARMHGAGTDVWIGRITTGGLSTGWQHYAFTWDGGTTASAIKVYINGIQSDTTNDTSGSFTISGDSLAIWLGAQNFNSPPNSFLNGNMALPMLGERAWSSSQIAELYRTPFLPYWQPSRLSIFDMRYDPSPYERKLRVLEDTFASITSPANIGEIDGAYSTIGPLTDTVYTFFISDEGRLLPVGATVTGFQIRIVSKTANNDTYIDRIQVYKGFDGYDVPVASGSGLYPIGTTDTEYTFGGSTELFGTTWTNSDIFGLEVSFYIGYTGTDTLSIDGIEITTWYSSGVSSITGSSTITFTPSSTGTGSGALVGSSTVVFTSTDTLTGSGALLGSPAIQFGGTNTLIGSGTLVGSSTLTFTSTDTLSGTGSLVGSSDILFTPAGTLIATGTLAGSSTITFTPSGSFVQGEMLGSSTITFSPTATASATGTLTGTATNLFTPSGVLGGTGTLTGTSPITFTLSSLLSGAGSLSGTTTLTFLPESTAIGSGSLAATSEITFTPSGSLSSPGPLVGVAQVIFTVSGTLENYIPYEQVVELNAILKGPTSRRINIQGSSSRTHTLTGEFNKRLTLAG